MKNFLKSKVIVNALIINVLVILTLIGGNYLLTYLDRNNGGGANIGGGLLMLLAPIITCFLYGLYRGKKNMSFKSETWILSFIFTTLIMIICMVISRFLIKDGREIFLVTTVIFPFDSILLLLYYGAGLFGEKILTKMVVPEFNHE